MKLDPPPRHKVRVHELAAELGWTPRQLIAELCRRGEYVKSEAGALEVPVVRDIRRDFAAISEKPDRDATVAPEAYGDSAERRVATPAHRLVRFGLLRHARRGLRRSSIVGRAVC